MQAETIVALSSGALPAGIAVVRMSGPACRAALEALAGGASEPRRAVLRRIRDAAGGTIDRGLVLFFEGPATVTGEDLAELHLHGGRAVVSACLDALTALPGVRLAEPGEFTRRAFENGRIDLTEAEGLADLLAAETETQRRQAVAQSGGALRVLYEGWMERLVHARAMLEASFDFSDEGDVAEDVARTVRPSVEGLVAEMRAHLAEARRGEILRHGFRVAIVGPPNAGKSSLLNALVAREVSIVTDIPGTTRDVIEVTLDLGGVAVRLVDTAGLRQAEDVVEAIGVERALAAAAAADLVLVLSERMDEGWEDVIHVKRQAEFLEPDALPWLAVQGTPLWPAGHLPLKGGDQPVAEAPHTSERSRRSERLISPLEGEMPAGRGGYTPANPDDRALPDKTPVLRILTKSDLHRAPADRFASETFDLAISTTTGEGLSDLVARIAAFAADAAGDPSSAIPARTRHREIVADALDLLGEALGPGHPPEIVAETLRRATDRLGALTGRVGVEDLLDVIFSAFCIGK